MPHPSPHPISRVCTEAGAAGLDTKTARDFHPPTGAAIKVMAPLAGRQLEKCRAAFARSGTPRKGPIPNSDERQRRRPHRKPSQARPALQPGSPVAYPFDWRESPATHEPLHGAIPSHCHHQGAGIRLRNSTYPTIPIIQALTAGNPIIPRINRPCRFASITALCSFIPDAKLNRATRRPRRFDFTPIPLPSFIFWWEHWEHWEQI